MTHKIILMVFLVVISIELNAQRRRIELNQADPRFTIWSEAYYNSVHNENLYFFIQNNTNDKYSLVVDVTVTSPCFETKSYKLHVNKIVTLLPGGQFTPQSDWAHIYIGSDKTKNCRLKVGDTFTFISGISYQYSNIRNITKEELDKQQAKLEAEKIKAKENQEKKENITNSLNQNQADKSKATTSEQQKDNAQNIKTKENQVNRSSNSDDDFWETGKKTNGGQSSTANTSGIDRSTLPEFFRTTDGKYYHKQGDDIQEVDYDQYMSLRQQRANEKKQTSPPQLSAAEQQKLVDNVMNKIKADQRKQYEAEQLVNKKIELQNQAFIAGRQVEEAKDQLKQNSQLQDSYESVEQLMADFNAKQNNVEALMEQLSAEREQQINVLANQMRVDNNPSTAPYSEAMGDLTNIVGGIVAYKKEQKEREMAYDELERQKTEMLAHIEAEKRRILTSARNDLFQRFKEGVIPTSSTKLDADSIFYFGYYKPYDASVQNATLEVTTIYPVYRYGDGTWPFKENIYKGVFVSSSSPGVLHGYYRTRAEAEAMRQAFLKVYTRTGGHVKQTLLKTKKAPSRSISNDDFWEEGKSASPIKKTTQPSPKTSNSNDDFWNN